MTDKENFVADVEKQIDHWTAEIAKFRIIAELAHPDEQIEFYQIIEDIVDKEKAVKEKLSEFDKSDAADLGKLKNEIGELRQRVEKAIEDARFRVN